MRSVPHRVVCLLGLDDGVFPRKAAARRRRPHARATPHVGDRDPRSEDRQLLLDALLAATDRLVITYTGNDERTNAQRPPAVPVGELLDVVDRRSARTTAGRATASLVRHPLQPFDPRNFSPGELVADRRGASTRSRCRAPGRWRASAQPLAPFLPGPLPRPAAGAAGARRPRAVRRAPRARVPAPAAGHQRRATTPTRSPTRCRVELGGLEEWGVGNRMLRRPARGRAMRRTASRRRSRAARCRPGGSRAGHRERRPVVERDRGRGAELLAGDAQPGSRRRARRARRRPRLGGTVAGVCGDVLRTVTYSRLSAAAPARGVGAAARADRRASRSGRSRRSRSGGRAPAHRTARGHRRRASGRSAPSARGSGSTDLVDLCDRGLREPLPLACQTSAAYAAARATGADAEKAAREAWESAGRSRRRTPSPSTCSSSAGS